MIRFPTDFSDLLRFFHSEQVEYLLVGGWAVAFHGHPRYTKDMDVWVSSSTTNAARVVTALEKFGFSAAVARSVAFDQPQQVIRIGVPPLQVDILTSIDGVDFDVCFVERIDVQIDDVPVSVISRERLIENKRASGRMQDLADAEALE